MDVNTDVDFFDLEKGVLGAEADVSRRHQIDSAADASAVDGRNYRLIALHHGITNLSIVKQIESVI